MKRYLVGKRISLHGLTQSDISPSSPYYSWLDDLSLDTHTERSVFPNSEKRMESYFRRTQDTHDLILLGIFDNESNKHIGNITFQEINWVRKRAFIGYLLGDKDFAGKGIVTEASLMMMYYGFTKLNFDRIHGSVSEKHTASRRVCAKVGLLEEGRMREHFLANGEPADLIIVGALKREWLPAYGSQSASLFEQPLWVNPATASEVPIGIR